MEVTAYRFKIEQITTFTFISMLAVANNIIKHDHGLEVTLFTCLQQKSVIFTQDFCCASVDLKYSIFKSNIAEYSFTLVG